MRFKAYAPGGWVLAVCVALSVARGIDAAPAGSPAGPSASPLTSPLVSPLAGPGDWPPAFQANEPAYPPALTPAQELRTFHMPPGYQVQLVASEPLVHDPIQAEFDGDGRLWVLEMPGFSQGEQMTDSREPINDLVILEDTNHDGVYDKRTVFLDHLILPRAFKILDHNCALVGAPPNLWKACDTNGDLKADTRVLISNTFGREGMVEHGPNGLFWGMDNTLNVSEHNWNLEYQDGRFIQVPNLVRGQWGVTQDDGGRIYRNVNTDALFVDYVPARYYVRNPDMIRTRGLYESLADQNKTLIWPVHPTLGVNRGYRPEVSRPNGSAYYYQGVSSPLIYRGDALPRQLSGQPFVLDGPTNIVHLLRLRNHDGDFAAGDFYKKGEFLASTDVRFRPVSLTPGWDGTFYIVDMYRGVSQDPPIQTEFLRNYIMQHRLWQTIHLGRIFRVVHTGMKAGVDRPHLLEESPAQLVAHLSSPVGWWRDTAQQLLVQRNDKSVLPELTRLASSAPDPRTRLQALWTLDGMHAVDQATVMKALTDPSADVRVAGVRLSEHWLGNDSGPLRAAVMKRIDDPSRLVRRQLAASLGVLPPDLRIKAIVPVLTRHGPDPITTDAAISGLKGLEGDVLARLLAQPAARLDAITMLAGAVAKSRDAPALEKVLAVATDAKASRAVRLAVLNGVGAGLGGGPAPSFGGTVAGGRAGGAVPGISFPHASTPPVNLPAEPAQLALLAGRQGQMAEAARQVLARLVWPGKPVPKVAVINRTPAQQALYGAGRNLYATFCSGCHQANGQGAPHIAAALAGSPQVVGPPDVAVSILLNGKDGPIGEMPPIGSTLTDPQLASVLTYVRGTWGNNATAIIPDEVKEFRQMFSFRKSPWTDKELAARIKPAAGRPKQH